MLLNIGIEDLIPILKLFNISIKKMTILSYILRKIKTFESIESDILLKLALNKASKKII